MPERFTASPPRRAAAVLLVVAASACGSTGSTPAEVSRARSAAGDGLKGEPGSSSDATESETLRAYSRRWFADSVVVGPKTTIVVGRWSGGAGSEALPRSVAVLDEVAGPRGFFDAMPGMRWVGVDSDGSVFQADDAGRIHRADHAEAALGGQFVALGRVPGARVWDAAGGFVVTASEERVYVSRDQGSTFAESLPVRVEAVAVRRDGVMVAQPRDGPMYLSPNGGQRWKQVGERFIDRNGEWILASDRCGRRVLADDGATWLSGVDVSAIAPHALRQAPLPSASLPQQCPRPKPTRSRVAATASSTEPHPAWYAAKRWAHYAVWPPLPLRFSVLQFRELLGQMCGQQGLDCRPTSALGRNPATVRIDRATPSIALVDMPPDCQPAQFQGLPSSLLAVAGRHFLLCARGPMLEVHTLGDMAVRWQHEATLPAPRGEDYPRVEDGGDGSVLVYWSTRPLDAWLRRPNAAGGATWHALPPVEDSTLVTLALSRGSVLAVAARDAKRVAILLHDPPEKPSELANVALAENLIDVALDTDGRALLLVERTSGAALLAARGASVERLAEYDRFPGWLRRAATCVYPLDDYCAPAACPTWSLALAERQPAAPSSGARFEQLGCDGWRVLRTSHDLGGEELWFSETGELASARLWSDSFVPICGHKRQFGRHPACRDLRSTP